VAGVIDAAAADAIENVVTFFEQFCRETIEALTAGAAPSGEDREQSVDDRGHRGSAGRDATDGENLTAQGS
jgi:hypothetical protein